MRSETQTQTSARKRVRATVVMSTQQGTTVQEVVMQGGVEATDTVMLGFTMSESLIEVDRDIIGHGATPTLNGAPPTPSTIPVTETQVERQLRGAQAGKPADVDLDEFMDREGFRQWMMGQSSDEWVRDQWGKDVLELFLVMKTIEDDSQALRTQREEPQKPRAVTLTLHEEARGSSSEPGMEGLGSEERRSKRVREGAIASTVGYVAPMDSDNDEEDTGPQGDAVARGQACRETEECYEDMDVQEMDDVHLLQIEDNIGETEVTFLMQTGAAGKFQRLIHQLLRDLDGMDKVKAARMANFLKSMLRDQQRMAPHLRQPILLERAENLQALFSVFLDGETKPQEEEQTWCLGIWHGLLPYLEGETGTGNGGGEEPQGSRVEEEPAVEEAINIVDSQEAFR